MLYFVALMEVEIKPTLFAVGALIVCNDELAVVMETRTSSKSVKVEGQETFPMETVEDYDTGDFATLGRACSEEVTVPTELIKAITRLNTVETRPGVELRNYAVELHSKKGVERGTFIDEVSPVEWILLTEVIRNRGRLRFRPGVYETVVDFYRLRSGKENFEIGEHRHFQLIDQIPGEIYRLIEETGLSGKEAVSQYFSRQQLPITSSVSSR